MGYNNIDLHPWKEGGSNYLVVKIYILSDSCFCSFEIIINYKNINDNEILNSSNEITHKLYCMNSQL